MADKFELVKGYLQDMALAVVAENPVEKILIVEDEDSGFKNLILDCEEPALILEQAIMKVPDDPGRLFQRLLQMNRGLVHGAFALDEAGETVLFRDTLELENLDRNELEASIKALSLALAEHGRELLELSGRPR